MLARGSGCGGPAAGLRVWSPGPRIQGPRGATSPSPGPEASARVKEGRMFQMAPPPFAKFKVPRAPQNLVSRQLPGRASLPPPLPGDNFPPTCNELPPAGPGRGSLRGRRAAQGASTREVAASGRGSPPPGLPGLPRLDPRLWQLHGCFFSLPQTNCKG